MQAVDLPDRIRSEILHVPCTQRGCSCVVLSGNPHMFSWAPCSLRVPPWMPAGSRVGIRRPQHHHPRCSPSRVYRTCVCRKAPPALGKLSRIWGRTGHLRGQSAWWTLRLLSVQHWRRGSYRITVLHPLLLRAQPLRVMHEHSDLQLGSWSTVVVTRHTPAYSVDLQKAIIQTSGV